MEFLRLAAIAGLWDQKQYENTICKKTVRENSISENQIAF